MASLILIDCKGETVPCFPRRQTQAPLVRNNWVYSSGFFFSFQELPFPYSLHNFEANCSNERTLRAPTLRAESVAPPGAEPTAPIGLGKASVHCEGIIKDTLKE